MVRRVDLMLSGAHLSNSQKRPEMRSRSDHFKPIEAELRLTARAGVDYTKRPEVKARRSRWAT
jgi:hypothetical protein